jgi:hypothetical protein
MFLAQWDERIGFHSDILRFVGEKRGVVFTLDIKNAGGSNVKRGSGVEVGRNRTYQSFQRCGRSGWRKGCV